MPYVNISSFKFGLDARRSEWTSVPGTLLQANNGHINQGGEFTKRLGFFLFSNHGGVLPTGCFGLEAGSATLYTFGSVSTPSNIPTGITYQQLVHPDGSTAMSGVVYSTSFGGFPFVIAKFTDGNTYCYYNGTIVNDFVSGVVLASQNTDTLLATEMARQINSFQTDYTANHSGATVDTLSANGGAYSVSIVKSSASGTLTDNFVNAGLAAIAAQAAAGQFTIVAGSQGNDGTTGPNTNAITQVNVNGVNQLSATVNFVTNVAYTANAIVANINANGSATVTAGSVNGTVFLYEKATGVTPNGYVVQTVVTGNVCIGQFVVGFSIVGGTTFTSATPVIMANGTAITTGTTAGKVVGTGGTYTTVSAYVSALALDINQNTATYSAFASGANLYLSLKTTSSSDGPINITFPPAAAGTQGVTVGGTPPLAVSVTPANIVAGGAAGNIQAYAAVTGGLPPYAHQWTALGPAFGVYPFAPNNYATAFGFNAILSAGRTIQFVDVVTDANGTSAQSNPVAVTAPF